MSRPLKILQVGFKLILLVVFLGLVIFAWRSNNDHRMTQIENIQLVRQVGLLNEDLVEEQETIKLMRQTWDRKPEVMAAKENTSGANRFLLECSDAKSEEMTEEEKAFVEKATAQLKEGETLQQVCLNKENDILLFATYKAKKDPDSRIKGENKYYSYGTWIPGEQPALTLLTSRDSGVYGGCGDILYWTKTGGIYISCGGGDGGSHYKTTYRIDLNNNYLVELAVVCNSLSDGKTTIQTCQQNCGSSRDCGANQFCDLATNSCVYSCKVEGQACEVPMQIGGECTGYGPVLGCKFN